MTELCTGAPPSWRSNPQTYHYRRSIHSLVEDRARRAPDAPAVRFLGRETSYRELNRQADLAARILREHGAGPGTGVALCMTHAVESVVGALAILKSGAAYVPCDPTHPPERLAHMVSDAGCTLAVAQSWTADLLAGTGVRTLLWEEAILPERDDRDHADEAPSTLRTRPPLPCVGPTDVAYVLYTSGSTGDPKGVVVEHGGVVNRLLWDQVVFPSLSHDRVLHHTSLGFDISVWEVFAPLAAGSCLVIAEPAAIRDPMALLRLIETDAVTIIGLTPSLLRALVDAGLGTEAGRSVRYVFCGGEALPTELVRQTHRATRAEVFNFYGPTEATIDSTYWRCRPGEETAVTPIGTPVGNCTVQVLDRMGEPVGVGVPGELLVGGAGLARGYTDPQATDAAFVSVTTDTGTARMYRTGDLVAWRADGSLDYLGRLDDQVKIRGHRIEPAEVETALRALEGVADAVVVATEGQEKRLVGFVIPQRGHSLRADDVRSRVGQSLPPYMVPATVLVLDAIPKNSNGKRDRRALQALAARAGHRASGGTGSDNPVTVRLGEIAGRILGIPGVDPEADFFDLGGSSLSAARFVALVRRELHTGVTLREFLARPTLTHLTVLIERNAREKG